MPKGFDHCSDLGKGNAFLGTTGCLNVASAHKNVMLQRSVLSRYGFQKVATLTGDCMHCTIQQSLEEDVTALIC